MRSSDLITTRDAARILRVGRNTVATLGLTCIRAGRDNLYSRGEVEALAAERAAIRASATNEIRNAKFGHRRAGELSRSEAAEILGLTPGGVRMYDSYLMPRAVCRGQKYRYYYDRARVEDLARSRGQNA